MPTESRTHRAGLLARLIYAMFAMIMPRLVRWTNARGGPEAAAGKLIRIGRNTNRIARLQRLRPFFGIRFSRPTGTPVPLEVVRRNGSDLPFDQAIRDGVILYFHGGGFFTGGLDTHLHFVVTLARRTGLPVVHVDYRQFPEVTVDGSVHDCVEAYRWLLAQGADPGRTVIAGDSAGGYLTFATALAAQRHGLPAPAGVVGISAVLELDGTGRGGYEILGRDAFGIDEAIVDLMDQVCPLPQLRHELDPINGALDLMPPALLIAADSEILRCDAERLCTALQQHGRPCRLEIWQNQIHAFPAVLSFLPESRAAVAEIAGFVAERLADAEPLDDSRRNVS
ncbi:alpha/beta hydrolase [[Mycobacterium] kokjensenii]|uniref:Alpha/beta hydrolase n=1 Tax=[Mycobacterium] kokjensenii TaxID=3064287 RepID=A0ABN9N7W6_9MYCO|nr:alpha/beta hydrolase [Mycolicibacter sp. MU0083]CAJ1500165.1 alpha/beta hydrolase [Mycolicibacter sp. MU0083]